MPSMERELEYWSFFHFRFDLMLLSLPCLSSLVILVIIVTVHFLLCSCSISRFSPSPSLPLSLPLRQDKVPTIHLFSGIQAMIAEQDLSVGGSTVCFSTTVANAVSYILTTTSARVMPWASTLAQLWAIVADETVS